MAKPASPSPVFDSERRYVTSYLCSPFVLGCIRLLLGTYGLLTNLLVLILSGITYNDSAEYFSFFTHLSYIGVTAWLWASGVQSIVFAKRGASRYPLQSWPRVLQVLHELLFATVATFPLIVTIVYWVLLASPDSFSTPFYAWSNISQHIMNSVFVLFELLCTNLPTLSWIYLPATIALLALYLAVAYLTYASQGFYPYDFLDPQQQGPLLAGYIVGIALGQGLIFLLVRYIILLRIWLVRKRSDAVVDVRGDEETAMP